MSVHSASPTNTPHVSTLAQEMMASQRPPSNPTSSLPARGIAGVFPGLNSVSERWQRALSAWFGVRSAHADTATQKTPRPDLQTYLKQYEALAGRIPGDPELPWNRRLLDGFKACGAALEEAVACRQALDELEQRKGSPQELNDATGALKVASGRAALMIADLGRALREEKDDRRTVAYACVGSAALAVASFIVSIVFPPALFACVIVYGGAITTWCGTTICWLFPGDRAFRPVIDAIEDWASEQPAELVEREATLQRLISETREWAAADAASLRHAAPAGIARTGSVAPVRT